MLFRSQKAERDLYQFVYEEAVAHAEHKKALRDPAVVYFWSYSQERRAKKAERDARTKARRSARIAEQAAQYPFKALHYRAQQVATEAMFAAYKTVYHEVSKAEEFVKQNGYNKEQSVAYIDAAQDRMSEGYTAALVVFRDEYQKVIDNASQQKPQDTHKENK